MNSAARQGTAPTPRLRRERIAAPRDRDGRVDLDACVAALGPVDVLETAAGQGWSYLVPHTGWRLSDDGHRTRLHHPGGRAQDLGDDPFAAVEQITGWLGARPDASGYQQQAEADAPLLSGGLVGAFSYDLGRRTEQLPLLARDDRRRAHLSLRVVEVVCAISPQREHVELLATTLPEQLSTQAPPDLRRDQLARWVRGRLAAAARHRAPVPPQPQPEPQVAWTSLPRHAHLAAVEQLLEAISAGALFQANLAQRLSARWDGDVHALYRALRTASPAAFGAALPDAGVASISPETFLAVDGAQVRTRPIKGTRPRAGDAALDAALADDLATATKDRAENVMVVDLERNDLGRVCQPGSVSVPELTRVEAHATVWHLVSTVTGRLRPETGYGDLLRATFPCGSITGAPKIAAMSHIERLEPVRRGMYCGAVGFLAPGHARLSVAIRTAVLHADGVADHGAGGGIVADSDPQSEHAETLDKAAAFLRAVAALRVAADPHDAPATRRSGGPRHPRTPADVGR